MDLDSTLVLNTDVQVLVDFEQGLFGWRQERYGRSWIDRKLLPLSPDRVQLLYEFQKGAKVADVLNGANGTYQERADEALSYIEKLCELGFLVQAGQQGQGQRPDGRFLELDLEEGFAELYDSVKNWGRWGDEDELGALNLITPETRRAASACVVDGETVSCSLELAVQPSPENPNPALHMMIMGGDDCLIAGLVEADGVQEIVSNGEADDGCVFRRSSSDPSAKDESSHQQAADRSHQNHQGLPPLHAVARSKRCALTSSWTFSPTAARQ